MFKKLEKFEFTRAIALTLIAVFSLLVVVSIPSLGHHIWEEILAPPVWLITVDKFRSILDLVLWILITVGLIETVKAYLLERSLRLEAIFAASMIALARKIIAVRLRDYDPVMVLGMAALIITVSASYYLIKKTQSFPGTPNQSRKIETLHADEKSVSG